MRLTPPAPRALVLTFVALAAATALAGSRAGARAQGAPSLKGDTTCKVGDADCNVCAPNVLDQFKAAFDGGISWKNASWHFAWSEGYPPSGIAPRGPFASGFENHIQGFIRTGSTSIPYAGTHDDDEGEPGAIFFIARSGGGRKDLTAIHAGFGRHPSGMQAIGHWVFVGDGRSLRLFDLADPKAPEPASFVREMPKGFAAGGGLGVVKLADGRHLVLAYAPGGSDPGPRTLRLYAITGDLATGALKSLGAATYVQPASWSGDYRYSENLSALVECGTGQVYTVTTEGDDSLGGDGVWLLSKVSLGSDGAPRMTPVIAKKMAQDNDRCHIRSSATVFVGADGGLELYCHERKAVKLPWETQDTFDFRYGMRP